MIGAFRFAWRVQRAEIVFVALVCVAVAAAAAWLAIDMRSILAQCGAVTTGACDVEHAYATGGPVALVRTVAPVVPFAIGLVLGAPIVSREVEHRTAQMAWSMSGSRLRWLAWRLPPVAAIGLALVALPALALDDMVRVSFGQGETGFADYEIRGVPVITRAALAIAMGVGIGAILGRLLPALLVGIGLSVAVSLILTAAMPSWLSPAELPGYASVGSRGAIVTDITYRLPDGTPIGNEEGEEMHMEAYQAAFAAGEEEPDPATLPQMVGHGIAADRYPEVLVRESAVLGGAALVAAVLAGITVQRRRSA